MILIVINKCYVILLKFDHDLLVILFIAIFILIELLLLTDYSLIYLHLHNSLYERQSCLIEQLQCIYFLFIRFLRISYFILQLIDSLILHFRA